MMASLRLGWKFAATRGDSHVWNELGVGSRVKQMNEISADSDAPVLSVVPRLQTTSRALV